MGTVRSLRGFATVQMLNSFIMFPIGHHKLPDVAASAGKLSSPVKLLAQGTVLDILGMYA